MYPLLQVNGAMEIMTGWHIVVDHSAAHKDDNSRSEEAETFGTGNQPRKFSQFAGLSHLQEAPTTSLFSWTQGP